MKILYFMGVLLAAIAVLSCSRNRGASEEEHHHHDALLQLTAYNTDFEVYAEATPFVVGECSEILTHISFLNNFKPLENGIVTVSLVVGSKEIHQTLEEPVRPGIFKFSLIPVEEGAGKLHFDVKTTETTSRITVEKIRIYSDEHEAFHTAEEELVRVGNGVVFPKTQSWKIDFSTEEVREESFGQIIRTVGQIQPSTGEQRIVPAKTAGTVLFPDNSIVEGKAVASGQVLFQIDGSGMSENNLSIRSSEAKSEYDRAKIEYERKAELAKENIVSQSELLKAKTELLNAEAAYNTLRLNFTAGKQPVSSPISGFVTHVLVQNGQYVEAGQSVLEVSQNRNLFVKAELQPKYFDRLNRIKEVNFRVLSSDRTYTLEELNGRILSFGKAVDVTNPLIPVVFQIANNGEFLSGAFVEMFIKTQTSDRALTVVNEALVEEMGSYFVYVQLTPELFEKRLVKRGETDGIRTEIREGVSEGERVVGKGAVLVKLAQSAGGIDPHAGHVH